MSQRKDEQRAYVERKAFAETLTRQFAGKKVLKIRFDDMQQCTIVFDDGSTLKIASSLSSYDGHHELEVQDQNIRYDYWE
ncbi:hypothetical protein A3C09_03855 [Candidatus Uhrbacteria bacterium RIFCSPHIGHO2_02_FULL_47_44]|uniref:Uncharacterized protein n=1 Tax=Candidatus Uhrbacteria bacterium RIFCSPLOWO2_02_FULL_48_18 TaxID=1802408 RepID=A0A1F7VDZ5_9BACT|nr:MAG: hypothetical protein A2839_00665 [Candidatus Uhrbacteria bacterium RIFCSPHIGHO2_01_FULL_47_10]OGL71813.1 MAG: hypothetical protein A3C09_03855 [Candidatus Uhrbacteria bacterium RIFCSPHIGHO2_02_FULL_47_44]OGL80613.1 MAG: hypothetical protein A3B20_04430 [Candidatus Uhrbacteria bacterium RIFCSPLOWO2_01_FULL_47_17]OGL88204.1 MAG: hypothetical protein A3I41_00550 [Candidatus Uhrbacteria bacterium RIFCSPLOWO2_02_FULL_48_18]